MRTLVKRCVGALAICLTSTGAFAEPVPRHVIATLAFTEEVTLAPTVVIGQTPLGLRQRAPIIGGTFSGPGIAGTVLNGGADWQLRRADGSLRIEADYMIETDDHVQIHVRNVGVVLPPSAGKRAYPFAAPEFEAPLGRYGWLNDTLFISTITPIGSKEKAAVRITIYRLDWQQ